MTKHVKVWPLKRPAQCSKCGTLMAAGQYGNAVGSTVFCFNCSKAHADSKGYPFEVFSEQPQRAAAPQNPVLGQGVTGNASYVGRMAFEQHSKALNDRLALRFSEAFSKIGKLEADNSQLRQRIAALETAVSGLMAALGEQPTVAPPAQPEQPVEGKTFNCKEPGCDYVADSGQALGGHTKIHSKSGSGSTAPAVDNSPIEEPNF